MDAVEFFRGRSDEWAETLALVQRAEATRLRGFRKAEIDDLAARYRELTADLARAQARYPESEVTEQLNHLVARAHAALYRRPPTRWTDVRRFLAVEFPSTVRARWRYTAVAALLFLAPSLVAYGMGRARPDVGRAARPREHRGLLRGGEAPHRRHPRHQQRARALEPHRHQQHPRRLPRLRPRHLRRRRHDGGAGRQRGHDRLRPRVLHELPPRGPAVGLPAPPPE